MIEKVKDILEELLEKYVAENQEEFLTEVSGENHYSLWFSEENMKVVSATMVSDNWSDQTRDICLFRKKSGYLDWESDNNLSFRENLEEMLDDGELDEFLFEELQSAELEEHAREYGEDLFEKIYISLSENKGDLISILQEKVIEAWNDAEIVWDTEKTDKHDEELTKQLFGNYETWDLQKIEDIRTVCLLDQTDIEQLCKFAKIVQDLEDNKEEIDRLEKVLTPAEAEIYLLRELKHEFLTLALYFKVKVQTLRNRHSIATQKIKLYEAEPDPEPFPC